MNKFEKKEIVNENFFVTNRYKVFKVEKVNSVKGGYLFHMDYLNEQDYKKIKALAESKGCEYDKYYAIKSFGRLVEEEKLNEIETNALLDFCKKYAV